MHQSGRNTLLALAASASLFFAGCGGGGSSGGGTGTTSTASLAGHLVLRNGATSNLGGVRFSMPRTGRTVTTSPDGSFSFGTVPTGTLTVRLQTAGLTALRDEESGGMGGDEGSGSSGSDSGSDGAEDHSGDDLNDDSGDDATDSDANDDGDNNDTGDDDCDVTAVADGESIDISVSIRDGVIESLDVSRSSHDCRESEDRLTRSADSDDADVEGDVETSNGALRQLIKVEVEHLGAGRSVRAVVINLDLVEADLGTFDANLEGKARLVVNTELGDVLPFGATTVADLVGFGIEVRDATAGTVLLFGTMPDSPTRTGEHHDHDGMRSRGRALLAAGTGAVGEAHVAIEERTGEEAGQKFAVEVEGEASGLTLDVFLEDPSALGTFTKIGSLAIDGEHEAEFERSTRDGDTLPYGVTSVSSLVGLHVELRNAAGGAVLYSGTVPALVAHD